MAHFGDLNFKHWAVRAQLLANNERAVSMRLLISLILPRLIFFAIGRPILRIVCPTLQIILVGGIPHDDLRRLLAQQV